ncbi:uncharacterized protein [Dermacentor andersoni]|uniref:uncharacterized protein n=1 Tax=Dermacentor andersoni TaxID=34620 RepID=UPI002155C062|nr:uncharacterized protein LOC126541795 [Dermacentor andersoni]
MKLLKTYGRRYKSSFLEASNTKRVWSPEVVLLQTPPRNQSEILFDSLCNPTAKIKRAPRGKVKYGNVTNLFNISSEQSENQHRKKSGPPCGRTDDRACRKRSQQNSKAHRKWPAAQQNGVSQSLADRKARPRRQNVKRLPTKLSLKSKKPQTQQLPPTSIRKGDFQKSKSTAISHSSTSSTSSCEIPRRHLKDDESFSLYLSRVKLPGNPVNPTSSTPKNDIKQNDRAYTDCIELSSLSDMNSIDISSPHFMENDSSIAYEGNKRPRQERTHTADGLVPSFLIPGDHSDWITIRKKRNRTKCKRDDGINRNRVKMSFTSGDASNSVWDTPMAEEWSPVLVSTPVSDGQVNRVEARKAWFLNCAMQTPRVAPSTICNNSVLVQNSAILEKQVQGTGSRNVKGSLKRKLASAVQFQAPSNKNNSGLFWGNVPDSDVKARSQLRDSSRHMSPSTSHCRSDLECSIVPLSHDKSSVELSVTQKEKAQMEDFYVEVADLQGGALSKPHATFAVYSAKSDVLDSQGSGKLCDTEKSKSRLFIEPEASHQILGNNSQLFVFQKDLRVKLVDVMKTSNADKCLLRSSLLVAQSDSEEAFLSEEDVVQETFQLKELRVVLTDLKHQETRLNKNAHDCLPRTSLLGDESDAEQSLSSREFATCKKFQIKYVRGRSKIRSKRKAHPVNSDICGASLARESQCTHANENMQSCLSKERALWEKFQLKDLHIVLTDLRDQCAIQPKNEVQADNTSSCGELLTHEPLCATFADAERLNRHHQSQTSSSELFYSNSAHLDERGNLLHRSMNTPFQHCLRELSEAENADMAVATCSPDILISKCHQIINSFACQVDQKLPQNNDNKSVKYANSIRKRSEGQHGRAIENEPLSLPAVALTCDTENTVSSATGGSATQMIPSSYASSKHKTDSEQPLAPCLRMCNELNEKLKMLKETKVVLKRLDTQRQLMQPPPPAALKKRLVQRMSCSNNRRSDCAPKERIIGANCNSSQNKSACKNNWSACPRRQARLTMARKSAVPSGVPLDANRMLLDMCRQSKALTFKQALGAGAFKQCLKIGEGTYGEVFRIGHGSKASAIKIVPIEGSFPVNGENQKTAAQILPEAIICQELSALSQKGRNTICPNFIEVKRLYYIQDRYHPALLKQWDAFDSKRASENDRPDCFKADQKFIVFQFADGGTSLEDYEINSSTEARSIFLQVACALAVAETALEFEHRDLHWGNILVAPTKQRHIHCHLPEGSFSLDTNGVLASVIDYTLSRLRKDGAVIYTDVSHEDELFGGVGDYQFDIYRRMKEHNQNDWKSYKPYTNALWLHYLSCKLLEKSCYSTRSRQQSSAAAELRKWSDTLILQCSSSKDIFLKCISTQSKKKRACSCVGH